MALFSYNLEHRSVTFVGVGNIGVQVYSAVPIKPISKNGIVGYRLPSLLKLAYSYQPGDTFVLYSDGISSDFINEFNPESAEDAQSLAESILRRYAKGHDDASVVVVRINA